ncbi:hypothetical protein [Prodigiosinella confusarubida]|nr:hypothetical protein [Serratia sp. ATCC 39006]
MQYTSYQLEVGVPMVLTDAVVRQAKATGKDYTIMMQMDFVTKNG